MTASRDLRSYLRTLDAETLAELLVEQAMRDSRLRHELELRAAAHGKVGPVLDTLQHLLDAGTQADLTSLALRTVDRTDGASGAERRRAIALYGRACSAHPPAPQRLADWILATQFDRPGWPEIDLADFAKALGSRGIARIKSVVDTELAGPRAGIARRLAEQLAEVTGDVDALLALLAAKPPGPEVNLKIIRVLRSAGRHVDAIAYAAQTRDTGDLPRTGLLALRRAEFRRNPTRAGYLALREAAIELGRWPAERPAALALLVGRDPVEAIPAYRSYVGELIESKEPSAYHQAALALRELRGLHRRTETAAEFGGYLANLLETHKRKTRLLIEIRNARIALPRVAAGHRPAAIGA